MRIARQTASTILLIGGLMACGDDGPGDMGDGGASLQSGGSVGSGGTSTGGMPTGGTATGGVSTGGTDAGMALPTCPEYPHLPYDGEWVGEAVVAESDCEDMPVGSHVPLFERFTIEVPEVDPSVSLLQGLDLYDAEGNHYSGFVDDDHARPSGPKYEGVNGADLTTQLFLNFEGNCLTGVMVYNSAPRGGGCLSRTYLHATRPNSMWK